MSLPPQPPSPGDNREPVSVGEGLVQAYSELCRENGAEMVLEFVQCLADPQCTSCELSYRKQPLRDEDLRCVTQILPQARHITALSLEANQVSREGAQALANTFTKGCHLTTLGLGSNMLGDEGCKMLVNGLSSLGGHRMAGSLTSLDVSNNLVRKEGCAALNSLIRKGGGLKELFMNSNKIDDASLAILCEGLDQPGIPLRKLHVAFNQIEDTGVGALATYISKDCPLTLLDLSSNRIGPAGAQVLADSLAHNCFLSCLNLRSNAIRGEGVQAFVQLCAKGRCNLKDLFLGYNGVTSESILSLLQILNSDSQQALAAPSPVPIRIIGLKGCYLDDGCCEALLSLIKQGSGALERMALDVQDSSDPNLPQAVAAAQEARSQRGLKPIIIEPTAVVGGMPQIFSHMTSTLGIGSSPVASLSPGSTFSGSGWEWRSINRESQQSQLQQPMMQAQPPVMPKSHATPTRPIPFNPAPMPKPVPVGARTTTPPRGGYSSTKEYHHDRRSMALQQQQRGSQEQWVRQMQQQSQMAQQRPPIPNNRPEQEWGRRSEQYTRGPMQGQPTGLPPMQPGNEWAHYEARIRKLEEHIRRLTHAADQKAGGGEQVVMPQGPQTPPQQRQSQHQGVRAARHHHSVERPLPDRQISEEYHRTVRSSSQGAQRGLPPPAHHHPTPSSPPTRPRESLGLGRDSMGGHRDSIGPSSGGRRDSVGAAVREGIARESLSDRTSADSVRRSSTGGVGSMGRQEFPVWRNIFGGGPTGQQGAGGGQGGQGGVVRRPSATAAGPGPGVGGPSPTSAGSPRTHAGPTGGGATGGAAGAGGVTPPGGAAEGAQATSHHHLHTQTQLQSQRSSSLGRPPVGSTGSAFSMANRESNGVGRASLASEGSRLGISPALSSLATPVFQNSYTGTPKAPIPNNTLGDPGQGGSTGGPQPITVPRNGRNEGDEAGRGAPERRTSPGPSPANLPLRRTQSSGGIPPPPPRGAASELHTSSVPLPMPDPRALELGRAPAPISESERSEPRPSPPAEVRLSPHPPSSSSDPAADQPGTPGGAPTSPATSTGFDGQREPQTGDADTRQGQGQGGGRSPSSPTLSVKEGSP